MNQSSELTVGQIHGNAVTVGRMESLDIDKLPPHARAAWEQLGRRLALVTEFDKAHPRLAAVKGWPVLRHIYGNAMRHYVLTREP